MLVANGTTTTERQPQTAHCKKLAQAGAVRIRWPADLTREEPEPETFMWCILQDADFNPRRKDSHMGWRLAGSELEKRAAAEAASAAVEAAPASKRRK